MPYKSEKIKLKGMQDRRRKLTDEQKDEIKHRYAAGECGMRPLAAEYGVSRRTIAIIVNPETEAYFKQYRKDHWKDQQQDKEKRTEAIRNTRRYKQELYVKGELNEE